MATMTDISIERACERLVLDFAYFSDANDAESLAALFTPKGTMMRPSGGALLGRAAILESYQSRAPGRLTRHICTNIRITVQAPDRATGITYAVVYNANATRPPEAHFGIKAEPRQLLGEFEDKFVLTDEGWKFAARRARFVMHIEP
jgi:uncharacterized protein (TIGR02246 family)